MASIETQTPKRTFKDPYKSTGDIDVDRLAFFHIVEQLKVQKRTGWVNNKVPEPESISDHMYRMAILSLCSEDPGLDIAKCVMLSIVHDLAEAQVGDITPDEGFTKDEKRKLEEDAMRNFVVEMLHDSPAAKRMMKLWEEYETQETPEARFVKDRIEMALQAREYELRFPSLAPNMKPFFESSLPKLQHPEIRKWGNALESERRTPKF